MVARKLHTVEKRMIPSSDRDIRVLIMRPTENARPQESTPGILWLHGGGHLHGMYQKMLLPMPAFWWKSTAPWWWPRNTAPPSRSRFPPTWKIATPPCSS